LRQETQTYADPASFVTLDGREWLGPIDMHARRHEVFERDRHCCVKCGEFLSFEQFEMHHVVSRGKGGDDSLENLQVLCGPLKNGCHRGSKGAKHP